MNLAVTVNFFGWIRKIVKLFKFQFLKLFLGLCFVVFFFVRNLTLSQA